MGITQAVAAIISGPEGKARLERDPDAFRQRYDLTPAELEALAKASPLGLRLAHNEHRTARLETLQAILPRTVRLLRPAPSARLGPYMEQVRWETTSIPAEARRLLCWLQENGGLEPALLDLARYETMIYEVAEDPAATRYAMAGGPAQPKRQLAVSDRLAISPAARADSFDYDVTAAAPTPLDHPLHLLAVKSPDRWGPKIYRLSDNAMRLLLLCNGERSVAEVSVLSAANGSGSTDVPAALGQLVGYGALVDQAVVLEGLGGGPRLGWPVCGFLEHGCC